MKNGYTLIEILIVVVIISITTAFAVLAFGDFGSSRRLLLSAEQFTSYLSLIQQQAILENKPFGLTIEKNAYQAYRFNAQTTWQILSQPSVFHKQFFPSTAIVTLDASTPPQTTPQIIVLSSGDLTPFSLRLSTAKKEPIATIRGYFDGRITLIREKKA